MVKWLLKADKGADLLSRWFLVYTVMTGAYAWLAKHVTFLKGLNWAELILVGIGCSLVTIFVVAASLALIRYFRPMTVPNALPERGNSTIDLSPIEARLTDLETTIQEIGLRLGTLAQEAADRLSSLAKAQEALATALAPIRDIARCMSQNEWNHRARREITTLIERLDKLWQGQVRLFVRPPEVRGKVNSDGISLEGELSHMIGLTDADWRSAAEHLRDAVERRSGREIDINDVSHARNNPNTPAPDEPDGLTGREMDWIRTNWAKHQAAVRLAREALMALPSVNIRDCLERNYKSLHTD
jgi:hypothetical protein